MRKMLSCIGGGETAQTLDASYYKGPGARNGKEREIIAEEPIMMSDRKGHNGITEDGTATTLTAQEKERPMIGASVVRRLTPLECERLQGYPDGFTKLEPIDDMSDEDYEFWKGVLWEKSVRGGLVRQNDDGVWELWRVKHIVDAEDGDDAEDEWENTHKPYKHKTKRQMIVWYNRSFCGDADSKRYKALGNSVALPFWQFLARRICAQYERDITMGSLFDGIGGFPLVFERCGAKAVWASEIEEFPIAVTKLHFPEDNV